MFAFENILLYWQLFLLVLGNFFPKKQQVSGLVVDKYVVIGQLKVLVVWMKGRIQTRKVLWS